MLTLNKVNTYYENSHILHNISMTVSEGEIVALIGRNGVGKTTTIRTIMGLTPPQKGSIVFNGKEITRSKTFQIAREGIGLVPEERWVFPSLSVHQNLLIGIKETRAIAASNQKKWTPDKCYEVFPSLKKRQSAKGRTLSGGEQQMLTIARTLVGNPQLILIDEPTEGLAPKIVEVVADVIREIKRQGITVLLVEQKLGIVLALADRIYVMSKGMIQWEGTPEALQGNDAVRKSFLEV